MVLAGASAGFLVWNWPPAKIFMGDVGSGFLGFVFGVLAIASAKERPWLLWPWLILLSVFIVDSTLTLMRRLIHRGAVVRGALQPRLSTRRPAVGQPFESDVDGCGSQRGLAVPACVGSVCLASGRTSVRRGCPGSVGLHGISLWRRAGYIRHRSCVLRS